MPQPLARLRVTSTGLPSSVPVTWASSGPPYCMLQTRAGSSAVCKRVASRSIAGAIARLVAAAAQRDPLRPRARDLDGEPRRGRRPARGGLLVGGAACGQQRSRRAGRAGERERDVSCTPSRPADPSQASESLASLQMAEELAQVGEIELCYETFGDAADPAVLLVMGLGTQMIAWQEEFCEELAGRGFHVVRFDNRDVAARPARPRGPPSRGEHPRRPRQPAYTLSDMAGDAAGLLDCLGVEAAHVVGASMGGMIAQMMAAGHPIGCSRWRRSCPTRAAAGRAAGAAHVPDFLRRPAARP